MLKSMTGFGRYENVTNDYKVTVEHRWQDPIQHLLGLLIVQAAGQARQRFDAAVFTFMSDHLQRFHNPCFQRCRDRRLAVGVADFDAQRAAYLEPFTLQRDVEIAEVRRNSFAFSNGDQRLAGGESASEIKSPSTLTCRL